MKTANLRRPLIAYSVRVLILTMLLVGVAIFVGHQQPPLGWVQLLRLNDCELPCWIGIEPGKTTFAEAKQLIKAAYTDNPLTQFRERGGQSFNGATIMDELAKYNIEIALLPLDRMDSPTPQTIVHDIYIAFHSSPESPMMQPTLGELHFNLGDAEALQYWSDNAPSILVMYKHRQIGTFVYTSKCNRVFPDAPLNEITISSQTLDGSDQWNYKTLPWRGFQRCNKFTLYGNQ